MSKSVSTTLDDKDYDALKALADEQDRNISGQVRHMLRASLKTASDVQKLRDAAPEPWSQPGDTHTAGAGSEPDDHTSKQEPPQEETKVLGSREHQEPLPG